MNSLIPASNDGSPTSPKKFHGKQTSISWNNKCILSFPPQMMEAKQAQHNLSSK
jgi:hypothetical protein